MKFNEWLDIFVDEKGIDTEEMIEAEGPVFGTNHIPVGVIIEHMKIAPTREQNEIKDMIVRIDFRNGNVMHFFTHLAKAIAK